MVTGAGGSIGSELCRLIARRCPEDLILVERAENNLFQINEELKRNAGGVARHACLADICDEERLAAVFEEHRPHIVFHAAAHKHVPLMEDNPGEAIKNNLFGTKMAADVADRFGVERFVLISTDKAVNPSSVMGTSKQLAERYVVALSQSSHTDYVVVRFGNVLGSAGSVVPIFREQIRRGGPVTVTHPEMQRYFMTIPEASQLVLQAAALGQGGEIFVLDMGEPVKIVDLAEDLIRLSGLSPEDIEMVVVGPRPGEKLAEEVFRREEQTLPTGHPKLRVARSESCSLTKVLEWMASLEPRLNESNDAIRQRLRQLGANYADPCIPALAPSVLTGRNGGNGNGRDGHSNMPVAETDG
jgi:FlaA1/EpsC-like NDP-sugar epimerase